MSKDRTNPRTYFRVAVGKKFQSAKDVAATPTLFLKEAEWEPNPQVIQLDPQGTHGSRFMLKDGVRNIYEEPICTLRYWATRSTLHQLLEAFMGGYATSSGSQLSIAGTEITNEELSAFRFPDDVDDPSTSRLTVEISGSGPYTIAVYKEAAKTTKLSEATGVAAGGSFATTPESGEILVLEGDLDATPVTGDYTLTVSQASMVWADRPLSYYTLAIDDGYKKTHFVNCWTGGFTLSADGRTGIRVEENVFAMTYDDDLASTLTASILDNETLAVRDLEMIYDSAGSNYSLPVEGGFSLIGEEEIESSPDNAANPEDFDREMPTFKGTVNVKPTDETQVILNRARSDSLMFKTLKLELSYGDYGAIFEFPAAMFDPNSVPRGAGKKIDPFTLNFEGRADGSASPVTVCDVTMKYVA